MDSDGIDYCGCGLTAIYLKLCMQVVNMYCYYYYCGCGYYYFTIIFVGVTIIIIIIGGYN